MQTTKDKILHTALLLFSKRGYDAVSVRDIAGELGLSQAALYKHYSSKQAILDSIIAKMEANDTEKAEESSVPSQSYSDNPSCYDKIDINSLKAFAMEMFSYWTEDSYASLFRRMLTIEQYKSEKMNELYNSYLLSGPIGYITDIFRQNGYDEPEKAAINFYSPMFTLISLYDSYNDKKQLFVYLSEHLKRF